MISVLNRLRPLSGSKPLSLLLIPLLLISCGAFKKTQPTVWPEDDVIVSSEKEDDRKPKVVENPREDKKEEKTEKYSMVDFKGEVYKVPVHKHNFEIAVLLPFHSDAKNSSKDLRRSGVMLEYYQGMKLAISEIEKLRSSFHIKYYDTDNDTNVLRTILKKPSVKNADLIIGPTDEAQVRIAAYYAKKHEIPLLSPMTTIENLGSDNPYAFFMAASNQMKAMEFLAYFKEYHKDEKLLIIRDGKRYDRGFGKALVDECIAQNINFEKVAYSKLLSWSKHLGEGKTVVLHTGETRSSMTNAVVGLLKEAENVTLVGPSKWMDFSNIDYSQLERLKITFLSSNKAYVANPESSTVYEAYKEAFKGFPSWYTYDGYDQMMFACESLDAFGEHFPLFLEGKSLSYANSNFTFKRTPSCFHNKSLHIFQLREKELLLLD